MTDPILYSVSDGLARITLNRPARLNAFNADLAHAWARVTAEATSSDEVGAIVLDAAGPAFCAGGDVVAMAKMDGGGADIQTLAGVISGGIRNLVESAIPVVAAAHGTTAGGGLGILLASDYAVVGEDSHIGSRYAAVGLTPDLTVTAQLARAVGQRRALQLVLSDRMLSAREAMEWGLIAEIVAPDAVAARAEEVARGWLLGASAAYGQAKRLIRSEPTRTFAEQVDEEARTIGAAFETPDARARVAAFAATSRTAEEKK